MTIRLTAATQKAAVVIIAKRYKKTSTCAQNLLSDSTSSSFGICHRARFTTGPHDDASNNKNDSKNDIHKDTTKTFINQENHHPHHQQRHVDNQTENSTKSFKPARLPLVLCHGVSGFDYLGQNPDFRISYWFGIQEALEKIGCSVHAARVPAFSTIETRAMGLHEFLIKHFSQQEDNDNDDGKGQEKDQHSVLEVNLVAHSMGGLDARYLIHYLNNNNAKSGEKAPYKIRSLTTLGTPHRGSSFADYLESDLIGRDQLDRFWTGMHWLGIERGAAGNLTTTYMQQVFNQEIKDDPKVKYFSYAAVYTPTLFSRFRFPWAIIMDREGPNDGLVSVKSATWGEYIRTLENVDHMDLMNWMSWNRSRFSWIWHSLQASWGLSSNDEESVSITSGTSPPSLPVRKHRHDNNSDNQSKEPVDLKIRNPKNNHHVSLKSDPGTNTITVKQKSSKVTSKQSEGDHDEQRGTTENDNEQDMKKSDVFNALELYLEISDNLYQHGL